MNKPAAQWTLASVVTKKVALAQVDDNAAMMMEEVVVHLGSGEEAAWLLWNPCWGGRGGRGGREVGDLAS